ncbi:WbqC family protein, partial [Streptomyces lavendulocolor]|uniref:WbqC family protein n=1 Tax=Streptomyces lavendulocolor TaxID=67316 RepID=UPI0033F90549
MDQFTHLLGRVRYRSDRRGSRLGWPGRILAAAGLPARPERSERLADLTAAAGADAYLCGTGGMTYLDPAPFTARGIAVAPFLASVGWKLRPEHVPLFSLPPLHEEEGKRTSPGVPPHSPSTPGTVLEAISFGESAVADEGAGDAGEGEEVVGLAFV